MVYHYKFKLLFFLIMLMSYNIYAQKLEGIFSFSLGDMGVGFNNSTNNEIKDFELNISLAIDIYTDFLSPKDKDDWDFIRFGPFASINWLLFEKKHFEPEFYIFNAGLRFTL